MTEAQEGFVRRLKACRDEIIDASEEFDGIEGHGPGGEFAITAALAAIDAAIHIETDVTPGEV